MRVYTPKGKIFPLIVVTLVATIGGLLIGYIDGMTKPLLSEVSVEIMRQLNDKYGFELGEDLLSANDKSHAIASLLKNDVLRNEGGSKNKGIIVKFKGGDENGSLILMTPKKRIEDVKLANIAKEYTDSIPEIEFAEADIALEIYSDGKPELASFGIFSKLMQSALQNASGYNADELLNNAGIQARNDRWWQRKKASNHNLRARLNFSSLAGRAPIAVLDSGADTTHPYFASNIWVNANEKAKNNVDDDHNGYIDDINGCDFIRTKCDNVEDEIGHGTHMIGIIKKYADGADPSKIAVLKVFDTKSESRLSYAIKAIKYAADNGMRVMNISFGTTMDSQALKDAVEYAYSKGAFIVAAAGNNSSVKPHYPAAYDKVISVGAYNKEGGRLSESNYGDWVNLSAPGERILSSIPDGRYGYLNGTSQAAPFVTAAVSNILLKQPNIGIEEMKKELKKIDFMQMSGPSPYDL